MFLLNVKWTCFYAQCPVFLPDFWRNWNIIDSISGKYFNIRLLVKSVQYEPSCLYVDRQTDRQTDVTKLIIAFQNFANAPEMAVKWTGVGSVNKVKWLVQCTGIATPRKLIVQMVYWRALKNCNVLRNSLYSWSTDVFLRITVFEGIPCTADLLTSS